MTDATFLDNRCEDEILHDAAAALLSVKIDRRLTLTEMGAKLGVSRTMMSQYIAGEAEMGWLRWQLANDAFPELASRVEETAYERALRAKQRALDLDLPVRRSAAG